MRNAEMGETCRRASCRPFSIPQSSFRIGCAMLRLTRNQVRDVDRRAVRDFHVPGIVLMENASRAVADAAEGHLRTTPGVGPGRIVILCGGGNNGGDGLAAARHL